jgi:hypothetical protein
MSTAKFHFSEALCAYGGSERLRSLVKVTQPEAVGLGHKIYLQNISSQEQSLQASISDWFPDEDATKAAWPK